MLRLRNGIGTFSRWLFPLLLVACAPDPPPSARPHLELFTCFHAASCLAALDAVLAHPDARITIHAVPQDAAERHLAERMTQLATQAPDHAVNVWARLAARWRADGSLGIGPALAWAGPEATGVPLGGLERHAAALDSALARYRSLGGSGGPVLLRNGIVVVLPLASAPQTP